MALTARQQTELDEVNAEIAQLQHRLGVSHGLGDASTVQGTSASFSDNMNWQKRLDLLRRRRNQLEDLASGVTPSTAGLGVLLSRWRCD